MKLRDSLRPSFLQIYALAAICSVGASAAQATITAFTDRASFLAAVSAPAVDSFDELPQGVGLGLGVVLNRAAGAYSYAASATARGAADQFYNSGTGADTWLSTNEPDATITLSTFSANTRAVGGFWFGTGADGGFVAGAPLTLVVSDASGASLTQNFSAPSTNFFLGFISDGALNSVKLNSNNPLVAWPSINDLVLAQIAPVPENTSSALMLLGLFALAWHRRSHIRAVTSAPADDAR
jgi:hypothetical protein